MEPITKRIGTAGDEADADETSSENEVFRTTSYAEAFETPRTSGSTVAKPITKAKVQETNMNGWDRGSNDRMAVNHVSVAPSQQLHKVKNTDLNIPRKSSYDMRRESFEVANETDRPRHFTKLFSVNNVGKDTFTAFGVHNDEDEGVNTSSEAVQIAERRKSKPSRRLVDRKPTHSARYVKYNVKIKNKKIAFPSESRVKGWWHVVVHAHTLVLIAGVFAAYILVFIGFVPIYLAISDRCGLHIGEESGEPFLDALYLSTETMTTIGYGVDDHFYNGCPEGLVCVMGQALIGFMMNAVLFGTVFLRVSRAQRRSVSIKFAPKVCIREIRGRYYLVAQVVESQQYQVIATSTFLNVTLQDPRWATPYQLHSARTIRPDDCLSQNLLLCLPNQIVHEIDAWSPLCPPLVSEPHNRDEFDDLTASFYEWPAPRQRLDDVTSGNRSAYNCIACGTQFSSLSLLRRHVTDAAANELVDLGSDMATCVLCGDEHKWKPYDHSDANYEAHEMSIAQGTLGEHLLEKHDGIRLTRKLFGRHWMKGQRTPHANCYNCVGNRQDGFEHSGMHRLTRDEIENWISDSSPEIIVVINATDTVTGSGLIVQHSYTTEDIVWDKTFEPCIEPDQNTGKATVNFAKFNNLVKAEAIPVGADAGFVQTHL